MYHLVILGTLVAIATYKSNHNMSYHDLQGVSVGSSLLQKCPFKGGSTVPVFSLGAYVDSSSYIIVY